ncbi:MAG: hypothetical protein ACKO14_08440 [Armatimonadota bacterium]
MPRLLDVSISLRLIVIALIVLFRGCSVPLSPSQPVRCLAESQIHRVFAHVHLELPTQNRKGGACRNLRALIRRRVRRVVRFGKAVIAFTLTCVSNTVTYWNDSSRIQARDTFCTSGISP